MRKTDYPRLRAWPQCPLCGNPKPRTALACWDCVNSRGIGAGDDDPYAERCFADAEAALTRAGHALTEKLGAHLSQDARRHLGIRRAS